MPALYWRGTFPDSPDPARRSLLLGLACSLEFERFMVLYGKYREDQARDDRGRFADEGRGEPETTGSLSRVRDDKTGDPLIDEITDRLHGIASQAHEIQTNFGIRNKEVDYVLAVRAEPRELHLSRLARADHTRIAGRA
jgi:hypothetical protein